MKKLILPRDFILKKNLFLKNFIHLTNKEKKMVRNWRNSKKIRAHMYTDYLISQREHRNFLNNLKNDRKNFYWLVKDKKDKRYLGYRPYPPLRNLL